MAKLNLVKKLVREDSVNVNHLIVSTIFGDILPEPYIPDIEYMKGDIILRINENGSYELLACLGDNVNGPFDPELWQKVSFTNLFKENSVLLQNNGQFSDKQEALADDVATLVYNLAGLIDNTNFNMIFRENFVNKDRLNIIAGLFSGGCIKSDLAGKLEFTLKQPHELSIEEPLKFKLKHYIELNGIVNLEGQITFNALDVNPFWFDINEAILDGSFFEIPEFEKEKDIPYALNIRIKGTCNSGSSLTISDLMVVFI